MHFGTRGTCTLEPWEGASEDGAAGAGAAAVTRTLTPDARAWNPRGTTGCVVRACNRAGHGDGVVVLHWCLLATAGLTWSGGRSEAALQIRPAHSRQTHGKSRGDVVDSPVTGRVVGMASWCSSGACERLLA